MTDSTASAAPIDILDKQQLISFFSSLPPQSLAQLAIILQRIHPDRLSYLAGAQQSEVEAAHRTAMEQSRIAQESMASQAEIAREALATAKAFHENLRRIPRKVESGLDQVAYMFWVQFTTGMVFAMTAIVLVFMRAPSQVPQIDGLLPVLFGAGGIVTMMWAVATSSPRAVQKNRIDLAQPTLVSTSWLNSLMAVTAFPQSRLQQTAHRPHVAAGQGAEPVDWPLVKGVHEFNLDLTERSVQIIEQLCEFQGVSTLRPARKPPPFARDREAVSAQAA
jgi:hypothetical protein